MSELTAMQSQGGIVSMAIDSLVNQVLKNADDGIEPTDEQIESVISFHNVCGNGQRSAAYWFRQKRVHLKRGFESFEAFGFSVLGHEKAYLHRLANAYSIELDIKSPMGDSIPERQLRPLSKIEPADRQEVWNDAIEKAREEGKKLGAKHVEDATREHLAKIESLQSDLMKKVEQIDEANRKISFQNLTVESVTKQNDDLRNLIDVKVSQGISEERAALIQENHDAIAKAERERDNAASELERLRREQAKAIEDGVTLEKNKLKTEFDQILYQIEVNKRDLTDLKKVKSELDAEVGALAVHKTAVKEIKNHLSFLTTSFADAFDTNTIPAEVQGEWDAIYFALSKVKKEMSEWRDRLNPLESTALDIIDA